MNEFLVREGDTLAAALKQLDANGLGFAFAVDGDGKLTGVVDVDDIARKAGRDGVPAGTVAGAMRRDVESAPSGSDAGTLAAKLAGAAAVALVDAQRRPVDFISPGRPRRIPVAEPSLAGNELAYVSECVTTSWISSQGPFVKRFETEFAQRLGSPNAIAVSNGTVALHLALLALGIGKGHEVIVPDLTFAATINAVIYAGATPVIVDVDKTSWNIDIAAMEAAITPRTRAIIPVHLYGQPADMDAIMAIAKRHDLKVIEDAAEAIGAKYKGKPCGAIGHAGIFSFFSNKLVTTGEGGMVLFQDDKAADHARRLRDHGMNPNKRYWHDEVGYNYRLTNMQAAIGCAQLEQLDRFFARKMEIAAAYRRHLTGVAGIALPAKIEGLLNSHWMVCITVDSDLLGISRDEVMARLAKAGVETRPLFYPLHEMPPYKEFAGNRDFAVTTALSQSGLSLPSAVTLTDSQIAHVCGVLARISGARRLMRQHESV
jgi:perosamine synthetase